MAFRKLLLLSVLVLTTPFSFAAAQSSEFTIKLFGSSDTQPPTTPVLNTAIPISSNQIDISWGIATDNFVVSGYVVSRDGSAIATTTLTNFSDTGLAPTTTYSYSVQAFDSSFNFSTSSNALATTTLAPVVVPPATTTSTITEQGQSTSARIVLDDLVIDVQETLAVFSIETRRPARFEIKWGRTNSYELGYVFNDSFSREYRTSITDLEPNTKYEYQLVSYTPQGVQFILKQGTFTTTGVELISMPANANRFTAVAAEGDVRLTWKNPPIDDFALVRVVRSHLSYPAFPTDGALIYQGTNEQVVDEGVLFEYSPAYYTAFVYDTNGNVSSGAVTKVYYQGISRENDATEIPRVADESVAPENQLQLSEGMPRTDDISIIQGDITSTFVTKNITLEKSLPFIISIPRTAVSNNLKTIIVTLSDPAAAQNTYSFILKLNKKMTAYEAIILPLESTGNSKFIVEIYDYNTRVVGTYETQITFTENSALITREVFFPDAIIRFFRESFLLYLLPFLVLWLLVSYYRHNR